MQKKEENTMTMLKLSDIEKVTGGVLDDDYIRLSDKGYVLRKKGR